MRESRRREGRLVRRQHENVACRQRSPRSVPAVFVAAKSLREDLPEPDKGAADRASRPRGVPLSSTFCGAGNLCTHRVSRGLPCLKTRRHPAEASVQLHTRASKFAGTTGPHSVRGLDVTRGYLCDLPSVKEGYREKHSTFERAPETSTPATRANASARPTTLATLSLRV